MPTKAKERRCMKPAKNFTMDDIARLANVSKPTVSRVLNGSELVTEKTRQRVLAVARANGYAINRNAKRLRSKRTNTIAVILDFRSHGHLRIADPFIFELLAGVSEALSLRKQDLLLSPPDLGDAPEAYQDMLRSKGADGFIFLGLGARKPLLETLAKQKAPLIVWGAVTKDSPYCAVGSDNFYGGVLAGRRLIEQKRKRLLFIGNSKHHEIELRWEGFKSLADSQPKSTSLTKIEINDFAFSTSFTAIRQYLDTNRAPDGIFAYNDTAAMAIISALREKGLHAPSDYSIIGYNDIPSSGHFFPAITTVRQDTLAAGSLLVEKLMSILDGNEVESVTLPTELIVRQT